MTEERALHIIKRRERNSMNRQTILLISDMRQVYLAEDYDQKRTQRTLPGYQKQRDGKRTAREVEKFSGGGGYADPSDSGDKDTGTRKC